LADLEAAVCNCGYRSQNPLHLYPYKMTKILVKHVEVEYEWNCADWLYTMWYKFDTVKLFHCM